MKYAALISYVGTQYRGWQKQSSPEKEGLPSVQETLERAAKRVTGEKTNWIGSGRTDSGVHSMGQVAHFVLEKRDWKTRNLVLGLNTTLPGDIRVLAIQKVPMEFHAQRDAIKKQYSYYFVSGATHVAHLQPIAYWVKGELDLYAMQQSVIALIGKHDFKAFQGKKAVNKTSVRRIYEAEILEAHDSEQPLLSLGGGAIPQDLRLYRFRIVGQGFLKQMVRSLTGTLIEIGRGKREITSFAELLRTPDRDAIGVTVPAQGLWQERVWYPNLTWQDVRVGD